LFLSIVISSPLNAFSFVFMFLFIDENWIFDNWKYFLVFANCSDK